LHTYAPYTAAVQELLDEVNESKDLDLEIDPAWNCPILDAMTINVGYKIHCKTGQPRTMSLAVDTFSGFTQSADGTITLNPKAKAQIIQAIDKFWSDGNIEPHTLIDVH
jgi:hypothetical protein